MHDLLCPDCQAPRAADHTCAAPTTLRVFPVPPSAADSGHDWFRLRECADMLEAELVAGLLASGGLHVHVESRTFRQEPMPSQRSFSRVVLWVPEAEAAEAQRVLADSADTTPGICATCGGPLDEAVCPVCAEAAPPME